WSSKPPRAARPSRSSSATVRTSSRHGCSARRCSGERAGCIRRTGRHTAARICRAGSRDDKKRRQDFQDAEPLRRHCLPPRHANVAALKQCGQKQCEIVYKFKNGCAALADGAKKPAAAAGATRDEAETKALRRCNEANRAENCNLVAWACTR